MSGYKFICVVVLVISVSSINGKYSIPQVTVEALQNGEFRVYIPDGPGVQKFEVHAKINQKLGILEISDFFAEVVEKTGDFWIAKFSNANIKVGDTVYLLVSVVVDHFSYRKEGINVNIPALLSAYPTLKSACVIASTVFDGGKQTCVGDLLISEDFKGPEVNTNKWTIAHYIPTYTAPNFLFNSYQNKEDTIFIKNGIIHLKPIPLKTNEELRGPLDLKNGCTSSVPEQCSYRARSWYVLPPTRSGKITSKISFKYGKVDIRANLPAGEWVFPVIKLEKKTQSKEENSPYILIAYSRGNDILQGANGYDIGSRVLFAGPARDVGEPVRSQKLVSKRATDPFYSDYHTYTLQWEPGKMTFKVDNVEYGTVPLRGDFVDDIDIRGTSGNTAADQFNSEYVLSLGVAVGGLVDFPDGFVSGNHAKPWANGDIKFYTRFFDKKSEWGSTWRGDAVALKVDSVTVTAI